MEVSTAFKMSRLSISFKIAISPFLALKFLGSHINIPLTTFKFQLSGLHNLLILQYVWRRVGL
jgi:hypothetical protein